MIACLIQLVIVAIVLVVLLWVFETVVGAVLKTPIPPALITLVRVLAALILLLYALACIPATAHLWPPRAP
jgi:hypothetical protein